MADSPLTPAGSEPSARNAPAAQGAAFVLCIENNETRGQALLLVESIREFGGRFARSPIFAVAPRQGLGVDAATRTRLEALDATYLEAPLNTVCPEYPSANRVYAAAWAARNCQAETLCVLDSDTLFLGEPDALGEEWDLAVRPVDVKGATSEGEGDPFESYWAALCELAGMSIAALPFVETVLDRRRVRASYNGGYILVRRSSGILERTADLFTRSVLADLRPYKGVSGHRVFASTGYVLPRASEYWGSNQAALAIAAWSIPQRVRLLDRRFNVPLHELSDAQRWSDDWADLRPLHVHYHWLLRSGHRDLAFATMAKLGVSADRLDWIRARASLIEKWPVPAPPRPPARSAGRSRQLVISGMHRSGTSLVASTFRAAGLEIGWDLMGPAPGNWRGHFEDSDFYDLHEAMLAAAGVTSLAADDAFTAPAGGDFAARARELIAARSGFELWGWKDPRTVLLLDFWDALLPEASYLFLYRHPIEVALSLRRRATDPEIYRDPWIGIRSWEVHNRRLLAFLGRHPGRCFLAQVPAITADLPGFVHRVSRKFDLPLRARVAASPFAPEELMRDLATAGLFPAWEGLMPGALALYAELEARADLPSSAVAAGQTSTVDTDPDGRRVDESRQALESLFTDLLQARLEQESEEATGEREPGMRRWTVVEPARLERLAAELAESRRQQTELERGFAEISARRDELAATLAAIERSRGFGLVAAGWRLVDRLRNRRKPAG